MFSSFGCWDGSNVGRGSLRTARKQTLFIIDFCAQKDMEFLKLIRGTHIDIDVDIDQKDTKESNKQIHKEGIDGCAKTDVGKAQSEIVIWI